MKRAKVTGRVHFIYEFEVEVDLPDEAVEDVDYIDDADVVAAVERLGLTPNDSCLVDDSIEYDIDEVDVVDVKSEELNG